MRTPLKHMIIIALAAAFLLSACGRGEDEITVPPNTKAQAATTVVAMTASPEPEALYTFADPEVQLDVERLLAKKAVDFTEADLEKLRQTKTLQLSEEFVTLADIPVLFPALAHLELRLPDDASDVIYDELAALDMLTALEVYTIVGFTRYDFFGHRPYVLLWWSVEAERTMANHADMAAAALAGEALTVPEGYVVNAYTRYVDDGYIFEVVDSRDASPDADIFSDENLESTLFIYKVTNDGPVLIQSFLIEARLGNFPADLFVVDANFDGQKDVLVVNGMYGTQGTFQYTCFLNRDGRFVHCESFSKISNAAIDRENQVVLGFRSNHSRSISRLIYQYVHEEFVLTGELTHDNLGYGREGTVIEARLLDGEMTVVSTAPETDYSEEELYAMFWEPETQWMIRVDRWLAD